MRAGRVTTNTPTTDIPSWDPGALGELALRSLQGVEHEATRTIVKTLVKICQDYAAGVSSRDVTIRYLQRRVESDAARIARLTARLHIATLEL